MDLITYKSFELFRKTLSLLLAYCFLQYWFFGPIFFGPESILNSPQTADLSASFNFLFAISTSVWRFFLGIGFILSIFIFFNFKLRMSAFIVLCLLFFLHIRNINIVHLGDRILFIFLLFLYLAPENWKSAATKPKQWWTFLILVQISLIYFLESFLKISTGWLNDNGLAIALQEKELITAAGLWLTQYPTAINCFGVAAFSSSVLIVIVSVVNIFSGKQKLLAAIGISYHLGAAVLLRLDWLPIASILPFLLFTQIGDKENINASFFKDRPDRNNLILIGFLIYGILATPFWLQQKKPNSFFRLPFQQTWAGYAPPSSYSALYTTTLAGEKQNQQSWQDGELLSGVRNISDLRVYKLYHNMLLKGHHFLRSAYLDYVCFKKAANGPSDIFSAELIADWVVFYPLPLKTGHEILLKKKCLN